jgi:hypothetical protein
MHGSSALAFSARYKPIKYSIEDRYINCALILEREGLDTRRPNVTPDSGETAYILTNTIRIRIITLVSRIQPGYMHGKRRRSYLQRLTIYFTVTIDNEIFWLCVL